MSAALQVRLLRVLQEKTYEPLGATHSERTDARIIVATNRDLAREVQQGRFREDLYYRVNVVRVELPPLRSRKEDIPLLLKDRITHFNRLHQKAIEGVSAEGLSLLMAHDWPGNVRELENVIERSFILCREGLIGIEHLPEELTMRGGEQRASAGMGRARALVEAQVIRAALDRHHQNRAAAARELGIHRSTLFRKMKKLGIRMAGS